MARGWGALAKWAPFFDDSGAGPSTWSPAGGIGPAGPQGVAGPQGPQGVAGPAGAAGPAGLNWKGAWSNVTAYVANDSVGRNGASWFTTGNTTGQDPNPSGDGHTAAAPWQLLAAQGATGPAGPQGAAGPQGPQGPQGPSGGALTIQRHSLGADTALGSGGTVNVFADNFAIGTWLSFFNVFVTAAAAAEQISIQTALGTAVGTMHDPSESDFIDSTVSGSSGLLVATFDVTTAGTVIFKVLNGGVNAVTIKAGGLTALTSLKVG